MSKILYNTTFFGKRELLDEFIAFLRELYIPATLGDGLSEPTVALLRDTPDSDGSDFRIAVHFVANSDSQLAVYQSNTQNTLLCEAYSRWGQNILCMPTAMDIIDIV